MGDVTAVTGGLAGISGRHLLQGRPPPVTTQLTGAAADGANTVVDGLGSVLQTLELEPQPSTRHVLQATSAPATRDAQLVDTVSSLHLTCMSVFALVPDLTESVKATALSL